MTHPCELFINGLPMFRVALTKEVLEEGEFQVNGCSALFVIKAQRQLKDAIALDCEMRPCA